jgi:Protein of unknown function (DUF2927)
MLSPEPPQSDVQNWMAGVLATSRTILLIGFAVCLMCTSVHVPKALALTDPYIAKFFDFAMTNIRGDRQLTKWDQEIKVVIIEDQPAPPELFRQVIHLFEEFHALTGQRVAIFTAGDVDGNVLVLFTDKVTRALQENRARMLPYFENATALGRFDNAVNVTSPCSVQVTFDKRKVRIVNAVLVVNWRSALDSPEQMIATKHDVARSVTYLLGALNPTGATTFESVTNPQSKLADFSKDDRAFLKILYNRNFPSGIIWSEAVRILRAMNE